MKVISNAAQLIGWSLLVIVLELALIPHRAAHWALNGDER